MKRMTHQQILKAAEGLAREAGHHQELTQSEESIDDITIRVLVTSYCFYTEALYQDRDPKVAADRVRKHINEQIEAELARLFSGQDITPAANRLQEATTGMTEDQIGEIINLIDNMEAY